MWQTTEPPHDTRVLASVKGKVWIGRYRPRWPDFEKCEWSFDGKTMGITKGWIVDGWRPLPEAMGEKKRRPVSYLNALPLSIRAANALEAAGLTSKDQILALTRDDLLKLKNVGTGTADEILECRNDPMPEVLAQLGSE